MRPDEYDQRTRNQLHTRILYDPKFCTESLVDIVNKERQRVPFLFNPSQTRYYCNRTHRDIILKARQMGFSSAIMALFLHDTMFVPNTVSLIVAQTDKDAADLFDRVKFMLYSIPEIFRPHVKSDNRRMLYFDKINSRYFIGSAESKDFGRSKMISNLHLCVHPDVKIISEHGFVKKISEIGTPTKQWNGDLISILVRKNSKQPIIVTPDHLILTKEGWKRADEVTKDDKIAQPIRKILNKSVEINIDIVDRYHVKPKYVTQNVGKIKIPFDYDLGWMIGIFVAEGTCMPFSSGFVFSLHREEEDLAKKIEDFFINNKYLKAYVNHKFRKTSKTRLVNVFSRHWANFLRQHFYVNPNGGHEKYIPDWVFETNKEFCDGLVRGCLDGDGNNDKNGNKHVIGQKRPQIIFQLRDLIASLGYGWASLYTGAYSSGLGIHGNAFLKYNKLKKPNTLVIKPYTRVKNGKTEYICPKSKKGFKEESLFALRIDSSQRYEINENFVYQDVFKIEKVQYHGQLYDLINQPNHQYRTIAGIIHNSEFSHPYYKREFFTGIIESVPASGWIVIESTARGEGNMYHQIYLGAKRKQNEYRAHYYRWFEHAEYQQQIFEGEKLVLSEEEIALRNAYKLTLEQIKWRRSKVALHGNKFIQEYPELEDEMAFIKTGSPCFDNDWLRARNGELLEQHPAEIWLGGELYIYKIAEAGARYTIGCLPDGELVHTNNGIKKIEEIKLNDKLFGTNGSLIDINKIYKREYNGNLIGVQPFHTSDPTYFTPEHPILVLKDNKEKRIRRKNINKKEYAKYLPDDIKIPESGQGPRFYYLDTVWKKANQLTKKDILVIPIRYTDKVLNNKEILEHFPDQSEIRIDRRLNPEIILNEDFWLFMGFYLAEGVLSKKGNGVGLCFGPHEYELRKKSMMIVKRLFNRNLGKTGLKRSENVENKILNGIGRSGVDVSSETIHKFINENFGRYSNKKHIAEWVKYLPKKLKLKLFEGWVLGDGIGFEKLHNSEIKHTIGGVSVNKKMLMDFQAILLSLGFISGIRYMRKKHTSLRRKGTLIFGRKIAEKDEYVIVNELYSLQLAHRESCEILKELGGYSVSTVFKRARHRAAGFIKDGYLYLKIRKLDEKIYHGIVNNFETEDHSYCCNLITVHNCDPSEGDINSDYSAASIVKSWPPPIEQVALLHGKWTPDVFSEKIWRLGYAYNKAAIAVERNNHGHAVLLNLGNGIVRNGVLKYPPYPQLYVGPDKKLGWLTTGLSKSHMIEELDRALRSGQLVINCKKFIEEARSFNYLGASKMGAPSGGYDDIVMSMAIAVVAIAGSAFDFSF